MNNKKTTSITITFIISIVFLFLYKLIPAITGIIYSIKDYSIIKGFSGSPWIGFQNFKTLFSDIVFINALKSTIFLNFITVIFTAVISFIMVYGIYNAKSEKQALIFAFVYALPAIVPSVLKASSLGFLLGIDIANVYFIVFPLIQAFKWAGFASVAAFLLRSDNANKVKQTLYVSAIAVLAIFSRILTSDLEMSQLLANPLILEKANVVDLYSYKLSFVMMKIGIGSAVWAVKLAIELLTTAVSAALLYVLMKRMKSVPSLKSNPNIKSANAINYILSAVIVAITLFFLIPIKNTGLKPDELNIPFNIIILAAALIISASSSVIAAFMAYPFSSGNKKVKIIYSAIIILSIYGVFYLQRFFRYRSLGIINTALPLVLIGFLPVWMIACYAIFINRPGAKEISSAKDYISQIAPVGIILAAINFSVIWGGFIPSLYYVYQENLFTYPLALFSKITQGTQSLGLNLLIFVPILIVWIMTAFLSSVFFNNKKTEDK